MRYITQSQLEAAAFKLYQIKNPGSDITHWDVLGSNTKHRLKHEAQTVLLAFGIAAYTIVPDGDERVRGSVTPSRTD